MNTENEEVEEGDFNLPKNINWQEMVRIKIRARTIYDILNMNERYFDEDKNQENKYTDPNNPSISRFSWLSITPAKEITATNFNYSRTTVVKITLNEEDYVIKGPIKDFDKEIDFPLIEYTNEHQRLSERPFPLFTEMGQYIDENMSNNYIEIFFNPKELKEEITKGRKHYYPERVVYNVVLWNKPKMYDITKWNFPYDESVKFSLIDKIHKQPVRFRVEAEHFKNALMTLCKNEKDETKRIVIRYDNDEKTIMAYDFKDIKPEKGVVLKTIIEEAPEKHVGVIISKERIITLLNGFFGDESNELSVVLGQDEPIYLKSEYTPLKIEGGLAHVMP